ncbi:histidine kinase dimerization/phospho-acceptor domain-containing protein, partial [Vibrio parahaemolyticus]
LERKVEERTKELEQALAAKTEFLNNLSHEISTPIQGFTVLSEGLVESWDEFDNSKKFDLAKTVASNAKRLASLMLNLLDLS